MYFEIPFFNLREEGIDAANSIEFMIQKWYSHFKADSHACSVHFHKYIIGKI
jgi:hypothetical protein